MNINLSLVFQLVVFIVLVWFTMKFIWPPIVKALDERRDKIAEGLAASERGKTDFAQAEKKVAKILTEGREKVVEMIAQADKRAEQISDEAKQKAIVQANQILDQAKAEIAKELAKVKESLREEVAKLAVEGAEKILQREVDPKVNSDILNDLKQRL